MQSILFGLSRILHKSGPQQYTKPLLFVRGLYTLAPNPQLVDVASLEAVTQLHDIAANGPSGQRTQSYGFQKTDGGVMFGPVGWDGPWPFKSPLQGMVAFSTMLESESYLSASAGLDRAAQHMMRLLEGGEGLKRDGLQQESWKSAVEDSQDEMDWGVLFPHLPYMLYGREGVTRDMLLPPVDAPACIEEEPAERPVEDVTIKCVKRTFQPSLIIRKRRHGFFSRMSSKGGRKVIARRKKKGRWRITA